MQKLWPAMTLVRQWCTWKHYEPPHPPPASQATPPCAQIPGDDEGRFDPPGPQQEVCQDDVGRTIEASGGNRL